MKILSVNIGKPQPINWNGETIITSIYKQPISHPIKIIFNNIEGDEQADLTVHGGADKAVYAYDIAYYNHWKNIVQRDDWSYGLFGENLTTEGFTDDEVLLGNIYKIGTAKLMAVQPRFPCIKLNARFGLNNMIPLFMQQQKMGTYFKIIEEGTIQVGNSIELIEKSKHNISIATLTEAYINKGNNKKIVESILAFPSLPPRLRKTFESFLQQ